MRVFIDSYLKNAPACMLALEQAAAASDWPGLMKAAHTFKPQVNYMGLTEIIPLVQDVEDCAAERSGLGALAGKVRRINEVAATALDELQSVLTAL